MRIDPYPLDWPVSQPRRSRHLQERARFNTTLSSARDSLIRELRLMGVVEGSIIISSNVPVRKDGYPMASVKRVEDPAVAVYFQRRNEVFVIGCDRWTRVEDNMQAIRKTVEALRGLSRWGTSQMVDAALSGYEALPSSTPMSDHWWVTLEVDREAPWELVEMRYRHLAKRRHPDAPLGSHNGFLELQEAFRLAKLERGE